MSSHHRDIISWPHNKRTRFRAYHHLFKDEETGLGRLSDVPKVTQPVREDLSLESWSRRSDSKPHPQPRWATGHLDIWPHSCSTSSFAHPPSQNVVVSATEKAEKTGCRGLGGGIESRGRGIFPYFPTLRRGKEWCSYLVNSSAIPLATNGREWLPRGGNWLPRRGMSLHSFSNT